MKHMTDRSHAPLWPMAYQSSFLRILVANAKLRGVLSPSSPSGEKYKQLFKSCIPIRWGTHRLSRYLLSTQFQSMPQYVDNKKVAGFVGILQLIMLPNVVTSKTTATTFVGLKLWGTDPLCLRLYQYLKLGVKCFIHTTSSGSEGANGTISWSMESSDKMSRFKMFVPRFATSLR